MTTQTCSLNQTNPKICSFIAGAYLVAGLVLTGLAGIFLVPELEWRADAGKTTLHQTALLLHVERRDLETRIAPLELRRDALKVMPACVDDPLDVTRKAACEKQRKDETASLETGLAALNLRLGQVEAETERFKATTESRVAYYDMGDERWTRRAGFMSGFRAAQLQHILVLVMGMAGGFLSLARAFVLTDRPDPQPADYFVRPLFGCMMAAIVYLAIKAGQFTLSTSSADKTMNSYTIALVAVVSGLMGQHALGAIERWGAGLFARFGFGESSRELQQSLAEMKKRLADAEAALGKKNLVPAPTPQIDSAKAAAEEASKAVQKVGNGSDRELVALANAALSRLDNLIDELERMARV